MSDDPNIEHVTLEDLLNGAIDLTENRSIYANNVRFTIGNYEVTLDLYTIGIDPTGKTRSLQAVRTHRVLLPISVAKDVARLLLGGITEWERAFGLTLPLTPKESDEDNEEGKETENE